MPEVEKRLRNQPWLKIAAIFVLTAGLFYVLDPEPHYKGRRLSHWLLILEEGERPESEHENARQAFKVLGERAVPFLLSRLKAKQPSNWDNIKSWTHKRAESLFGPRGCDHSGEEAAFENFQLAIAFSLLGENRRPAIGEIERLLPNKDYQHRAALCLAAMGTNATSEISRAVTSTNRDVRAAMAYAIGKTSPNGIGFEEKRACEILTPMVNDPDATVRLWSIRAIGWLWKCPQESVAALRIGLADADSQCRAAATSPLHFFGTNAVVALPEVKQLLTDKDYMVRSAAEMTVDNLERPRRYPSY